MKAIENDAKNLSNFEGDRSLMAQMVEDGFEDDDYDGFADDDLSFDGSDKSFKTQHNGKRLLILTIDNTANATDSTVGLFGSFNAPRRMWSHNW